MTASQSLSAKARNTAYHAFIDIKRKYTGNPYFTHLCEVAGLTASSQEIKSANMELAVAVAYLHDIMEDCGWTFEMIVTEFGQDVAHGVMLLSDLEEGNREARKEASKKRLMAAPSYVQTIKCADLISNTSSIALHDANFAVIYLEEAKALLDVLLWADIGLRALAYSQVNKAQTSLEQRRLDAALSKQWVDNRI